MINHRVFVTEEYANGYLDALHDFAHWKDGQMYVGTCGTTYKEVVAKVMSASKNTVNWIKTGKNL